MEKTSTTSLPWKSYQKIGFRFVLIFFLLFIILLDWSAIPIFSYLYYYGSLSSILDSTISWFGKNLFDIPYVIVSPYDAEHNDRTYVYLLYFLMASVALLGTIIWSFIDRKRPHYELLYYWFTVIIRYYLAFTMFLFALYKFFRLQFPDLDYYTLTEQVGDLSPMHLAWAFFGYSHSYNIFMGLAEGAGLLLLFRRTTTLGALIIMGALANVIAVNYSFDVHAKMYPTALFIMALFLILKDTKRIIQFFLTGKAVALPVIKAPVFSKKWMRIAKIALKFTVIVYFLIAHVLNNVAYWKGSEESLKAKATYAGIYDIDSFVMNGDTLSKDNPIRWRQLIIGDKILEAVRFQGDSIAFANLVVDKKEILVSGDPIQLAIDRQEIYNEMGSSDDTYWKMDSILVARQKVSSFGFELTDPSTLLLKGHIKKDALYIIARRRHIEVNDFRLIKRRFHWINEASYFY